MINNGNEYIVDKYSKPLIKFLKSFSESVNKLRGSGYSIKEITVSYIVIWYDKESDKEYRIPLPKIIFQK